MSTRPVLPVDPVKRLNALLRRVARGNRPAFTEVCVLLEPPLRASVDAILHDRDLARDVVQETLLAVWVKRRTINPRRNGRAWIFRIAHNLAIDYKRSRSRRRRNLEALAQRRQTALTSVEDAFDARERAMIVNAIVDSLPAAEQKVFRMRIEGLRFKEIATEVSVSVATAWRLYRKAEEHIRQVGGLGMSL